MQLPLIYLDASAIEEVPLPLWREAFEMLGWPASLGDKQATFTHDDARDAILNDDLADNLLQALEILHTLGTEAGREAITSVMSERRAQLSELPDGASERELAMRLYLEQRGSASMADVLVRAQTQIQESGDRRCYNEFVAKEPRAVGNLKRHREMLRAAVLRHCKDSDLGDHVQVEAFEDDVFRIFSILRSDRMKKPLAVVPGRSVRALIPFRPVHGDILRYDVSLGRLRITVRASSMVEFYRVTLGSILVGDEDFFSGDSVCSLTVLQQGRAALDKHGVFGVSRVRLTGCLWECGDRSRIVLRDEDCFDLIERHRLSLAEGTFVQAKLKVDVIGTSTRPVVVNVRVPSRIEVSQKRHERLIDDLLGAIGIRTAAPPANQRDIWSLYPWRHPLTVWRALFGVTTDTLVERGVLRHIQLQAVPHPDHPNAGSVLHVEQLSEWDFHGVSEVAEVPSRSLSATDVEGLELVPELFRQYLCTTLGITESGAVWSADNDLLELGWLPVGDERLYLAYAIRQPRRNFSDGLRGHADGAHVVLLTPATRSVSGLATVALSSAIPSKHQVITNGTMACGFADRLPAVVRAPQAAELVVDKQLKKIWVCGNEVQNLSPDSQQFQFVEMLAGANGHSVSSDAITKALSAARLQTDGTTTARQAKSRAKKHVIEALQAAGAADRSDPFPSVGPGFYRCRLRCFVG